MIQAARLAPARRRASGLSRALLPPPLALRPVGSGRAGRRCVRCSGPHETALRQPAPSPSFLHFAALRSVTSAPAESAPALRCARQGAGLASTAARTRQSLRLVPRGGSAIPLPLVALRLRSLRSLRPGPHGRALARDRAARLRLLSRAVTDQYVPLKCLHGRRRCAPPLEGGCAPRRRPFRPGAPVPAPELRACGAAPRVARCGHGSRPPLRCGREPPGLRCRSGPLRAASPGARTKTSS